MKAKFLIRDLFAFRIKNKAYYLLNVILKYIKKK